MNVEELIEVLKTYDGKSKIHNRIAMIMRIDEESQERIQESYNEFIENKYIYDGLRDCSLERIKTLFHDKHNSGRSYLVEDLGLHILDGWRR